MMAMHRLALQLLPDRTPHGSIRLKVQRISIATLRRSHAFEEQSNIHLLQHGLFRVNRTTKRIMTLQYHRC